MSGTSTLLYALGAAAELSSPFTGPIGLGAGLAMQGVGAGLDIYDYLANSGEGDRETRSQNLGIVADAGQYTMLDRMLEKETRRGNLLNVVGNNSAVETQLEPMQLMRELELARIMKGHESDMGAISVATPPSIAEVAAQMGLRL